MFINKRIDFIESSVALKHNSLFWNHEKNSANWWLCINLEDSEIGVLAHELFHATHRILEYFGVEFTSKNHEPFAYLLEYLMNECIKLRK